MAQLKNLSDKERLEIVTEDLEEFNNLIKGHKKLLTAIEKL